VGVTAVLRLVEESELKGKAVDLIVKPQEGV